jgi:hypothetical protein
MFYIFGEIKKVSTDRIFRKVRDEGNQTVTRKLVRYKLDRINSIGYREKQGKPQFTIKKHELVQ